MSDIERKETVIKAGTTAMIVNILLAFLEAFEGVVLGELTVILDGLSHITEAAGSFITVLATKLGSKKADKKHPYGYGRLEYMAALSVAGLIIYAGITALIESVEDIIHPSHPHINVLALVIVAISLFARIYVGRHDIHTGHHVNSHVLVHAGKEELVHSLISLGTLASGLMLMFTHIYIGPYIGIIIAIIIIYNGWEMLKDSISTLLGQQGDVELLKEIRSIISAHEQIEGAYDLAVVNYGPVTHTGSVHISVLDTMNVADLDCLTRRIVREVKEKTGVILTGVSVYSINTHDEDVIEKREYTTSLALSSEHIVGIHGFYVDKDNMSIRFDAVVSHDADDPHAVVDELKKKLEAHFSEYHIHITLDIEL